MILAFLIASNSPLCFQILTLEDPLLNETMTSVQQRLPSAWHSSCVIAQSEYVYKVSDTSSCTRVFLSLSLSLSLAHLGSWKSSSNLEGPEECSLDFTSIKVNQEECDASRKKVPVVQLASKLRSKQVLDNFGWPSPKRTRCSGGWCFWSSEWRGRGTVEQRTRGSYNYQENAE